MYGYEIIKELEKRFSGHWKPKTGTIYPALDKLEQDGLLTSQIEFRDEGPDRRHYALTERGVTELESSIAYWIKMMQVLETYRETHESIFRYKSGITIDRLSKILIGLGESLKGGAAEISKILPAEQQVIISPKEPIAFKFLFAKENHKLEIHMEIEWVPKESKEDV